MRSIITGIEIVEKSRDDTLEESLITGMPIKKAEPSGIHNNMTGMYDSESEVALRKARGVRWPTLVGTEDSEAFVCDVPFCKADKEEQIVYGIVYEPDTEDSQGDEASAAEIEKAAHAFLANSRVMKVMHKGKPAKIEVVESYIAPEDFELGEQEIKKGSWVVAAHVSDKKIWKAIKDGTLTGFSMAGVARAA